ncbi:MAG: CsiV family protein [Gammaproteobacteria bacterium]|nr:CsiV family protein [Gammaproteobacteria bacterium]
MPRKFANARLCAGVVAALMACSAAAARDYEVEIIVFDRLAREAGRAPHEQWDFSSARVAARLDEMKALAARASSYPTSARLASLEPLRLRLLEADYRILDTARWRQPATFYPNAPLIALGGDDGDGDGDDDDDSDGNEIGDGDSNSNENSATDGANGANGDHAANPLAAGFVRVYRTSLIYADLNLQLSPPLPEAAAQDSEAPPAATWQPHYFIAEKRRLKFKQIHYFDHPLFGAILQVWPVEVEDAPEEVDAADAGAVDADTVTPAADTVAPTADPTPP